jgi:glycerophosphoryl diester phosphodiesterase
VTYFEGPRPRLFAHRGASGSVPENTIEAFREGLAAGADRLELDVHASADGHIVVFHDEDLSRTTDAEGLVRERSLAELKRLDAGYRFEDAEGRHPFRGRGIRIPTLDEVLAAFPTVPLNIEVKQFEPAIDAAVLEVLDRHRARDRVLLAAFDDRILRRLRALAPEMASSLSFEEAAAFVGACMSGTLDGYEAPGDALQVPPDHEGIEIVTPLFVTAAHDLGMEVHVWTINDEAEMDRLLGLGIDGLMSDFPALARSVFERRGFAR